MKRMTIAVTLAATTATALVATAPLASSANPTKSFAYGLSVAGEGKQPYVESTDGSEHSVDGSIPANPLLSGAVLRLVAGDDAASVEVANLEIGGVIAQLPREVAEGLQPLREACAAAPEEVDELLGPVNDLLDQVPVPIVPEGEDITRDDLVALCETVFSGEAATIATVDALDVRCTGDTGSVTVTGARLLGAPLPVGGAVAENTALAPENPLVNVTLNRQTPHDDGSFTVDGLVVSIAGEAEIVLGSATCGVPIPVSVDPEDPADPVAPAPAPVPVRSRVAVTG